MKQAEPAELAAALERQTEVPDGPGERYVGYGVLGIRFRSGDILAFRRFPATSAGAGYTSVWHRRPDGGWTFYLDTQHGTGCARHFAPALERIVVMPIRIEWPTPRCVFVSLDGGRLLSWTAALATTSATAALNRISRALPARWWLEPRWLRMLAAVARVALGTGRLTLTGRTPAGSVFIANPKRIWAVTSSRATFEGHDLGRIERAADQPALGDFVIPRRPLFAIGAAFMVEAPPAA
jgi:hypothetical protein